MDLHLEEQEASLAFKILRNRLDGIKTEIHHDKDSEVREYLRHKEAILNGILEKFPEVDEDAHKKGFQKNR